ncbi:MAG: AarF/ABC1/UbiB kinase family protein [Lentisphaeria bacterium]|nr:AarF/ABC1/UbiB kinase family protein [Lentisphaeria bacterium]
MEKLLTRGLKLNRDLRFIRRFWTIVETVGSYGFNELADTLFPDRGPGLLRRFRPARRDLRGLDRPTKLRRLLEELGPTFVKLGQILSTRPDVVGPVYASELRRLTEHVTPFPFAEVKSIIEKETGRKTGEIFSQLDEQPLAAASIGQVHAGVLRKDNTRVVVKVRRPGIVETIEQDLEIMRFIASRLDEPGSPLARFRPVRIVGEFSHSLRRELNYMTEAANLNRFAADCRNDPHIKVPRVWFEYTSTRVLVMEFIEGDSAAEVQSSPELRKKYDLEKIAGYGVNSLLNQIFVAGFFHADPHPGNIILLPDNRLCFIDFGMMGRVGASERRIFLRALGCMMENDIPRMVDFSLKMTLSGHFSGDRAALERDAADLVDANLNLPLEKLSLARILSDLLKMLREHGLALRPDLYMMFKSLITIEQLGRDFSPQLKIVDMIRPFLAEMKVGELDPRRMLRRFVGDLGENVEFAQDLPASLHAIIRKLEAGEISWKVEHHRLNEIEETLYVTGERLSRSLLLAALFLGSALVIVAKIPPLWNGIPLPGIAGFLISGVLSVYALWSDHRQRTKFLRDREKRRLEEELRRRDY